TFRFPDDDHQSCFIPGRRLVDETDAFDDHVFIDVTGPVTAVRNFPRQTVRPFQLAHVSDLALFPEMIEVLPSKSFIEAGKLDTTAGRKESEGFLRERGSVPGTVPISRTQVGIQAKTGLPFKGKQRLIAF